MTKHFCDICGDEVDYGKAAKIDFFSKSMIFLCPVHLSPLNAFLESLKEQWAEAVPVAEEPTQYAKSLWQELVRKAR
jgi:hypothetical protein